MKQTHDKILDAAKTLFEENGFAAATTRKIAERAGVSEVTLFRHFDNKRNLFEQTVKSCMHPYKLQEYLKNEVTYDLETDLGRIASQMMQTYQQNLPMLRMVMKDRRHHTVSKKHLRRTEHKASKDLTDYFEVMQRMGKVHADPRMATKFFFSNIAGFFMRNALPDDSIEVDQEYFDWMIGKIITALKTK